MEPNEPGGTRNKNFHFFFQSENFKRIGEQVRIWWLEAWKNYSPDGVRTCAGAGKVTTKVVP